MPRPRVPRPRHGGGPRTTRGPVVTRCEVGLDEAERDTLARALGREPDARGVRGLALEAARVVVAEREG